jgi:riboflavin biosynthesis pyrimidine reductase
VRNANLREVLAELRDEQGVASVAIEAGPATTRALYEEPLGVDELMLSICRMRELPPGVRGGELLGLDSLNRLFRQRNEQVRHEESGAWSFLRLRS